MVGSINRTASTMQSRSRKRGFPKLSHHDGIGHIDTDGDHALQGNRNGDNCYFL